MIALMYDGLELGTFYRDDANTLKLKLHDNIKTSWLPYIFEQGLDHDMEVIIKAWMKERVFPKNRFGKHKLLKELGLKRYNIEDIARVTRCSLLTDPYWIAYEEGDRYSTHSVRGQKGFDIYPYNSLKLKNEEVFIWRK